MIAAQTDQAPAARVDGFSQAFMAAFADYEREMDGGEPDSKSYQMAVFAHEGAKERVACGTAWTPTQRALAALVSFEIIKDCVDGYYSTDGRCRGETAALIGVMETLRSLWREADRAGGQAARPFAKYVGAPEKQDLASWAE